MSKVTLAYDAIVEKITELFPDKRRIPNAYSLPDNSSIDLVDGFGITIGANSPEDHDWCTILVNQSFGIPLTKEVVRLESDYLDYDTTGRQLLEEAYMIRDLVGSYTKLGVENIVVSEVGDSDAPAYFVAEKSNFMSMTVNFTIKIKEMITN